MITYQIPSFMKRPFVENQLNKYSVLALIFWMLPIFMVSNISRGFAAAETNMHVKYFEAVFSGRNRYDITEKIRGMSVEQKRDPKILMLLKDVLYNVKKAHRNFNWKIIDDDNIKIEIASVLVNAHSNKTVYLDHEKLRRFFINLLNRSDDNYMKSRSLIALSSFDKEVDVEILIKFAKFKNISIFKASITSLHLMCNNLARDVLKGLEQTETDYGRKKIPRQKEARI